MAAMYSAIALLVTLATVIEAKALSEYDCRQELPDSMSGDVVVVRRERSDYLRTHYEDSQDDDYLINFGWKQPRIFYYLGGIRALLVSDAHIAAFMLVEGLSEYTILLENLNLTGETSQLLGDYWLLGKDYGTNLMDLEERMAALKPTPRFPGDLPMVDCRFKKDCQGLFGPVPPDIAGLSRFDDCFDGVTYCRLVDGELELLAQPLLYEDPDMMVFTFPFSNSSVSFKVHVVDKRNGTCYKMRNNNYPAMVLRFPTSFNFGYGLALPTVLIVVVVICQKALAVV